MIIWDTEKTALVRQLYQTHSASMIARDLSRNFGERCSRSAVMGKIFRLELRKGGMGKLPPVNLRVRGERPPKRKRLRPKPKVQTTVPEFETRSPPCNGIQCPCRLVELEQFNCRWGIGDPREKGFHFCGAVVVPDQPYCPSHYEAAHEPGRPRH